MSRSEVTDRKKIIRLVKERLEFVNIITQLNDQFRDPELIRKTPEGGWTHPWIYFDSLRNYLLLTCFDLLGQTKQYKDFHTWLVARSTKDERKTALSKVSKCTPIMKAVRKVHREYLDVYGIKKSFFRFINEVIPTKTRTALFYSVRIRKIDSKQNLEIEQVESEEDKAKFLFAVRNLFTHRAINVGSPAGGVFVNFGDPILIDGKLKQGWHPIYWEEKPGLRIEYSVRDWPTVLKKTVSEGLNVI